MDERVQSTERYQPTASNPVVQSILTGALLFTLLLAVGFAFGWVTVHRPSGHRVVAVDHWRLNTQGVSIDELPLTAMDWWKNHPNLHGKVAKIQVNLDNRTVDVFFSIPPGSSR